MRVTHPEALARNVEQKGEHCVQSHARWHWMAILALVPFAMVLGNSVLIPVLPDLQSNLGITRFQSSLLITLFSVPAGIVIPVAGVLSDRFSRKRVIIPGLVLFGLGGVVAGVAAWLPGTYPLLLCGRIIQGIGAAGTAPIAMALAGDLFQGSARSKVLGMTEAGNALGKVLSPVIGALLALWAWPLVFWVFPLVGLPLAFLIWRGLPSEQPSPGSSRYLQGLISALTDKGRWLVPCYLTGATALFTLFGVLVFLSEQLETVRRVPELWSGLILGIPLALLTVASFTTGWLIRRQRSRMKLMVILGLGLLTGSLAVAAWMYTGTVWLVVLLTVAAAGTGTVLPALNTLITSAVSEDHRGIVTSFYEVCASWVWPLVRLFSRG